MIAVAVMVAICAVLGTIALGMVTDPSALKDKDHFVTSGAYESFEKLGLYYGVGSLFRIIYAITQGTCFLAALIISIDAPLRVLLDNADTKYIPKGLLKKTKRGAYRNGLILVVVIVTILMIVPALGAGNNDALNNFLTKMNSVCMPLRYCWVFVAYYFLKKRFFDKDADYKFLKNKYLGMSVAIWCFLLTLISCIMGMYTTNKD
jgi:amino acid transporter